MDPMQAIRIYVVRHGQTNFNAEGKILGSANASPDNDLNPKGMEEARDLARKLSSVAFDQVFTSTLNRARQTCDIITNGREPTIDMRINERNWRKWEGRSMDEFNTDPDEHWKEVETDKELQSRALEVMEHLARECPEFCVNKS